MLATIVQVFGLSALVGVVIGVFVAVWVAPETSEGFRLIVFVVAVLVTICLAASTTIIQHYRQRKRSRVPVAAKPANQRVEPGGRRTSQRQGGIRSDQQPAP